LENIKGELLMAGTKGGNTTTIDDNGTEDFFIAENGRRRSDSSPTLLILRITPPDGIPARGLHRGRGHEFLGNTILSIAVNNTSVPNSGNRFSCVICATGQGSGDPSGTLIIEDTGFSVRLTGTSDFRDRDGKEIYIAYELGGITDVLVNGKAYVTGSNGGNRVDITFS
jgi:hypothetical protein